MGDAKTPTMQSVMEFVKTTFEKAQKGHGLDRSVYDVERCVGRYKDAVVNKPVFDMAQKLGYPIEGTPPNPETAALDLLSAVEALPEFQGRTRPAARPVVEQQLPDGWPVNEDGAVVRPRFPTMVKRLHGGEGLRLVGGLVVQQKLQWVRELMLTNGHEDTVVWIETEDDMDGRSAKKIVNQMKSGAVFAVVFFQDFMSHEQTTTLITAGRDLDIPVAPGSKAGQASLLTAFTQIEEQLAQKAKAA